MLKVGLSPSNFFFVVVVICFIESPLKTMEKAFYFILKALSSQDISAFTMTFWSCRKNGLISKVNFKNHDVTTWLINNCNTRIAQQLTKKKQPDNETQSINRMQHEKYFSSKFMQKMRLRDQFQTSFYFLKMLNMR